MYSTAPLLLLVVYVGCASAALTSGMDKGSAMGEMVQHSECLDFLDGRDYSMYDTTNCGNTRCSFPSQACVVNKATAFKTSNGLQLICRSIPSSCANKVGVSGGSSSSGGAVAPQQPAATSGSGSSSAADCTSAFSRGSFCPGASRSGVKTVYYWNGSQCARSFYFGCGGNGNQYPDNQACMQACSSGSSSSSSGGDPAPAPVSSGPPARCTQAPPSRFALSCIGGRYGTKWFWDTRSSRCASGAFLCNPSTRLNLFGTQANCNRVCNV